MKQLILKTLNPLVNMGIFNFKKKKKVVDLSDQLRKKQKKLEELKSEFSEGKNNVGEAQTVSSEKTSEFVPFPFFGSSDTELNSKTSSESDVGTDDTRKKLSKRLKDMTEKLEDLSNQIYRLEQRIELVEKKLDIRRI